MSLHVYVCVGEELREELDRLYLRYMLGVMLSCLYIYIYTHTTTDMQEINKGFSSCLLSSGTSEVQ